MKLRDILWCIYMVFSLLSGVYILVVSFLISWGAALYTILALVLIVWIIAELRAFAKLWVKRVPPGEKGEK